MGVHYHAESAAELDLRMQFVIVLLFFIVAIRQWYIQAEDSCTPSTTLSFLFAEEEGSNYCDDVVGCVNHFVSLAPTSPLG